MGRAGSFLDSFLDSTAAALFLKLPSSFIRASRDPLLWARSLVSPSHGRPEGESPDFAVRIAGWAFGGMPEAGILVYPIVPSWKSPYCSVRGFSSFRSFSPSLPTMRPGRCSLRGRLCRPAVLRPDAPVPTKPQDKVPRQRSHVDPHLNTPRHYFVLVCEGCGAEVGQVELRLPGPTQKPSACAPGCTRSTTGYD